MKSRGRQRSGRDRKASGDSDGARPARARTARRALDERTDDERLHENEGHGAGQHEGPRAKERVRGVIDQLLGRGVTAPECLLDLEPERGDDKRRSGRQQQKA